MVQLRFDFSPSSALFNHAADRYAAALEQIEMQKLLNLKLFETLTSERDAALNEMQRFCDHPQEEQQEDTQENNVLNQLLILKCKKCQKIFTK